MTVSRVVNNDSVVIATTRAKVEAAIAQLNYIPNPAAQSLAGKGQFRLVLLFINPSPAFMSELLLGCLDQVRSNGAQLQVEHFDPAEPIETLCARLRQNRIDAVLLPGLLCDDTRLVRGLAANGFLVSRIAATRRLANSVAVGIDDEAAAYAMTRHLIDLGHQRIGFIAGPADQNVSALRSAGHARAMRETGGMIDPSLTFEGDFTYRSGMEATEQFLSLPARPTAVFASNDDMAAGAIAVAHRHHLDVPKDLSVCGYDDTSVARTIWPELSTVHQPVTVMASRAIDMVLDKLRNPDGCAETAPAHELLDFSLVIRASTARLQATPDQDLPPATAD